MIPSRGGGVFSRPCWCSSNCCKLVHLHLIIEFWLLNTSPDRINFEQSQSENKIQNQILSSQLSCVCSRPSCSPEGKRPGARRKKEGRQATKKRIKGEQWLSNENETGCHFCFSLCSFLLYLFCFYFSSILLFCSFPAAVFSWSEILSFSVFLLLSGLSRLVNPLWYDIWPELARFIYLSICESIFHFMNSFVICSCGTCCAKQREWRGCMCTQKSPFYIEIYTREFQRGYPTW